MHPLVLKAYEEEGFNIHIGNTFNFPAMLVQSDRLVSVGGGMCVQDMAFTNFLSSIWQPDSIYMIGNAFGYSSLNFAAIFPNAIVDVIDAEVEGDENVVGSDITRNIARKYFPNLTLFKGFSPQDLDSCRRSSSQSYSIGVIDGYHHPDQAEKDFRGLLPYLKEEALVYYHDAGMFGLTPRLEALAEEFEKDGWKLFKLDLVPFGACVLLRNLPDVEAWVRRLQTPYNEWKNPVPTDRVGGRAKSLKAIKYKDRIYYPHEGDIIFCGDMNANLTRLALDMNKGKQVAFYGARGTLAEDVLAFLDNYRDRDIIFFDKALAGSHVDGWPVHKLEDLGPDVSPDVFVVTASISGEKIISDLKSLNVSVPILPLYDHNCVEWNDMKEQYLDLSIVEWTGSEA